MKALLQPVELRWIDSAVTKNWDTVSGMKETGPVECRTIGYLLQIDKDVVKVVQSRYADNPQIEARVADMIAIPRACVRKITLIRRSHA